MGKEGRFYVEYLGWKETAGLYGTEMVDPIARKLIERKKAKRHLHRMTIKVTSDKLKITENKIGSRGKTEKIKYPSVLMHDVSYVTQSLPPNTDVVSCVFLGYNAVTKCPAHVHTYRFDSPDTATVFVKLISSIIDQPDYRERILAIEKDLVALGQIKSKNELTKVNSFDSDSISNDRQSPTSTDSGIGRYQSAGQALKQRKDIVIKPSGGTSGETSPKLVLNSVHDELEHRLGLQRDNHAPILLPPKDYDTIVRRHGHLTIRAKMKQRSVLGDNGIFKQRTNGSQQNVMVDGIPVRQAVETNSQSTSDDNESGSTNSGGNEEELSVYGLYRGIKTDGQSSLPNDMVMWSPEFSYDHNS